MTKKRILGCLRVPPVEYHGCRAPFDGFRHFFLVVFLWSVLVLKNRAIKQAPPTESHTGRRHTYAGVLPGAPRGSFSTQLSPPQCPAAKV